MALVDQHARAEAASACCLLYIFAKALRRQHLSIVQSGLEHGQWEEQDSPVHSKVAVGVEERGPEHSADCSPDRFAQAWYRRSSQWYFADYERDYWIVISDESHQGMLNI